jgi:hypothetical protein
LRDGMTLDEWGRWALGKGLFLVYREFPSGRYRWDCATDAGVMNLRRMGHVRLVVRPKPQKAA